MLAVARVFPSGEIASHAIAPECSVWPGRCDESTSCAPEFASHQLNSKAPRVDGLLRGDTIERPSSEKARTRPNWSRNLEPNMPAEFARTTLGVESANCHTVMPS